MNFWFIQIDPQHIQQKMSSIYLQIFALQTSSLSTLKNFGAREFIRIWHSRKPKKTRTSSHKEECRGWPCSCPWIVLGCLLRLPPHHPPCGGCGCWASALRGWICYACFHREQTPLFLEKGSCSACPAAVTFLSCWTYIVDYFILFLC